MGFPEAALEVLASATPCAKARAARRAAALSGNLPAGPGAGWPACPRRPARPQEPRLVPPGDVPRRRPGSPAGRVALLHALAHIEFNAIDLAFDMALRFAPQIAEAGLDWRAFIADWAHIGDDEARHFEALDSRLRELGSEYGALPAHDGLWSAAENTADDALARLAIAPMVLEARGLDVTPTTIEKLERLGDHDSASVLSMIYRDEVSHVAAGVRWFRALCEARALAPGPTFAKLVQERFAGALKGPFNHVARAQAGLSRDFYADIR